MNTKVITISTAEWLAMLAEAWDSGRNSSHREDNPYRVGARMKRWICRRKGHRPHLDPGDFVLYCTRCHEMLDLRERGADSECYHNWSVIAIEVLTRRTWTRAYCDRCGGVW